MSRPGSLSPAQGLTAVQRGPTRRLIPWAAGAAILTAVVVAVLEFPYDVDVPLTRAEVESNRAYYADAYKKPAPGDERGASEYEGRYTRVAQAAAEDNRIKERIDEFVKQYGLKTRPVLEIGSGRGNLQDAAEDYTGLDISANVRRFYHKTFVLGSATSLPFPDDHFEGAWSIWVFEHVPNPEQALSELRRVMKDGGVVFLLPAWDCKDWAADGYEVRPYSDFGLAGRLIKAGIPVRSSLPYYIATSLPDRLLRTAVYGVGGETRLHYRRLAANYESYWVPDSDAVNSLDRYEVMLWFLSRGDECLNGSGAAGSLIIRAHEPLIIRVHKS